MTDQRRASLPPGAVSRLVTAAAVAVACTGTVTLLGWAVDAVPLPDWGWAAGPIRPESGVAFLTGGAALLLLAGRPARVRRAAGHGLGAVTALIGLLGVLDQFGARATDLLHLRPLLGPAAEAAPVLRPTTAISILLVGVSLAALDLPERLALAWSQLPALATGGITLVSLLAYVFEAGRPGLPSGMPLVSAAALLVLATGAVLARPEVGVLRPFSSSGPGGTLARRLAPVLALVPFGTALFAVLVIRVGHGPPSLAVALSAAVVLVISSLVLSATIGPIDEAAVRQEVLLGDLAAERDFTRTLLQSLSEAVVVFDRDLRVIDVNRRACELLGRERGGLVGELPPHSWQPTWQPAGRPDGRDEPERTVVRPDGTTVPVLARMSPVLDADGRPRAYVGTFVDITDRKRAEDALADRAAEAEQANDRLQHSNQQLSDAAEFKRDLMSLVSHEVSQPLSSVTSLAELLASDWDGLPDEIRLELTQKIDKNARRLANMINDMVQLFRLDAGTVSTRRESVPIGEVVDTVAESTPETAQIAISGNPDLCALVDRGHLWQVLTNLVNNAMAHGEPPIEIRMERTEKGVVVCVCDHGPGIPEERLPHLFDRVSPFGGGRRRSRGSGLGLFIVRHLVEVNGGKIWYERLDPRGAKLTICLEPAGGRDVGSGNRATGPDDRNAPANEKHATGGRNDAPHDDRDDPPQDRRDDAPHDDRDVAPHDDRDDAPHDDRDDAPHDRRNDAPHDDRDDADGGSRDDADGGRNPGTAALPKTSVG